MEQLPRDSTPNVNNFLDIRSQRKRSLEGMLAALSFSRSFSMFILMLKDYSRCGDGKEGY